MERGAKKCNRPSLVCCDALAFTLTVVIIFSGAILLGQAKPLDPPSSSASRTSSRIVQPQAPVSLIAASNPTNVGFDQQSRPWGNSAQFMRISQNGNQYQAQQPPSPGYSSTTMIASPGLPTIDTMKPVAMNVVGGPAEESSPALSSSSGFIRLHQKPISGRVYNFNSNQGSSGSGSSLLGANGGDTNGWVAATGKSPNALGKWPEVIEENPVDQQYQSQQLFQSSQSSFAIQRLGQPTSTISGVQQQDESSRRRNMVEYHNKNSIEAFDVNGGSSSLPTTIVNNKGTLIGAPTTSGRLVGIAAERVVTSDFEMWELDSACPNSKNQQVVSSTMGVSKRNQDYVNNYVKTISQTIDRTKDPLHNFAVQNCAFVNQSFEAWEATQPEDPCVPTPAFSAERGTSRGYSFEALKEAFLKVQVYTLAQRVTHDVLLGSNPRPSTEIADNLRDMTCNLKRMRDTIRDVLMFEMDFEVPTSTSTPYEDDDIKAQCCIPQQYCVKTMTLLLTTRRFLQNLQATWVA